MFDDASHNDRVVVQRGTIAEVVILALVDSTQVPDLIKCKNSQESRSRVAMTKRYKKVKKKKGKKNEGP